MCICCRNNRNITPCQGWSVTKDILHMQIPEFAFRNLVLFHSQSEQSSAYIMCKWFIFVPILISYLIVCIFLSSIKLRNYRSNFAFAFGLCIQKLSILHFLGFFIQKLSIQFGILRLASVYNHLWRIGFHLMLRFFWQKLWNYTLDFLFFYCD